MIERAARWIPGIGAAALLSALVLAGCDREKRAEGGGSGEPSAASTAHYDDQKPRSTNPLAGLPVAPPAPKPTGPLPAGTSCITSQCHASYARAAYIHAPTAAIACETCHDADAGGHKYPLKRDPVETCTFCHSVSGTLKFQHKALEQGCTSCHQPHASNAKFLLKQDTVERTCAACHDTPLKKYAHSPFAEGQCSLCHHPHQADNPKLLRGGEGARHCFTCHEKTRDEMTVAAHVHKPAADQCSTCHHPHASDYEHHLRLPIDQMCYTCHEKTRVQVASAPLGHGAVTEGKMCINCHSAHDSGQPQLLRRRADALCLECHDKDLKTPDGRVVASVKSELTESKFLHGPVAEGNCWACHDVHGAQHANLLKLPFASTFYARFDLSRYELCFSCHDPALVLANKTENLTNFRNGGTNLHFVHVNRDDKGRSCKTCHAMHGSDLPNHMAASVPFEGSKWAMPIQFEKTADGGRCAPGCHGLAVYQRGTPAPRPATRGAP